MMRLGLLAAVAVLIAACGGSGGLSEAERTYCLTTVSPIQMDSAGDALGVDMTDAFEEATTAADQAQDEGKSQSEITQTFQSTLEAHPDYVSVCQSLYEDR